MVTPLEIGVLVLAVIAVLAVYFVFKLVKPLIVNAIVGLVILVVAGFAGFGVNITWVVVLIVALGGIPGAIIVILLAHFDLMFEPAATMLQLIG